MFVSKESNSSEWKQWGIGFVDNTLSSVEQAISGWFWNLINDLPRDYFAKTFDQVNYFDRSVWEGIFRARIEDIKEQLESGVSKKTFEADIIKLQGLIGKHSLSPLVYEDGLKELEGFVSDSNNHGKQLQLLVNIRNEFREELKGQPLLLKECIKNDTNLGQREVAYYKSLLDSASSKETPVEPSTLGKSIVSSVVRKNEVTNSKLRNISKLLFCNPAQAITLFLAGQVAFANAVSIQSNNSSAVENSTLPLKNKLFNLSEVKKEDLKSNISIYNALNEATTLQNVSELRLEEKADKVEKILANSTLLPFNNNITDTDEVAGKVMISPSSGFAEIPEGKVEENVTVNTEKPSYILFIKTFNDEIEKVKNDINKLIIALTKKELDESATVDVLRSKRSLSTNGSTTNNLSSSGTFTRPNPSSKVAKLENEMRKMKEDIEQLKQSSQIGSEDRNRLASLETTVETLKRLLDDHSRETEQRIANLEGLVESLISIINGFRNELDDMKKKAAERETIQKQKGLPAECIEAIKSHNFKAAEEKLQEINDDSKINFIIKETYNYQISNFDLVLKFGDDIRNIKRSFLVYKALNYEMESNGHKDPFKMIKLIENLRKEIINQSNTSSEIKGEAEFLASSLKDRVKTVAKEKLKDGMLYDRYASVKEIADKVYNFDSTLFGNAVKEAVDDIYGRVDTEKILSLIRSHSYIEQIIQGCAAVFDKMKSRSDLNNKAVFKLAYYIKETMEMSNYRNVDQQFKSDLESLKNKLPESVKNVVFSSSVCIKNTAYHEYFYAANFAKWGNDRRRAFTWVPGSRDDEDQDRWKIESDGDNFSIKNIKYGEYLYAASDGFNYDDERRRVFTWIPGGTVIQSTWKIEPDGNNVYIKNVQYSEYLFAHAGKYDSDRRYVFTFIPGRKTGDSLWSIKDCSSGRRKRDAEAIEAQNNIINVTAQQEEAIGKDVKPSSKIHDLTLENVSQNISSIAR